MEGQKQSDDHIGITLGITGHRPEKFEQEKIHGSKNRR